MYKNYGPLSTELYDLTKPVGHSLGGDIEYYLERLQGITGKVLEAGVGSGRFYIPLMEKGFDIEGIDYSPEMLASCRKQCKERGLTPTLYEGNVSNFSLDEQYEAIVMPTGSFCLIENYQEAVSTLTSMYRHLVPGGRIILDLLFPTDWKTGEITSTYYQIAHDEGIALERKAIDINWVDQYTLTVLKYEKWQRGTLMDTELQKFLLRWYGIEEFKLLLQSIGYSDITCSANYTFTKQPSQETSLITFEAVR
ncbi:class I SAM-dependent methyltransferase [Lysinibacillus cavernae]|uniref:class I SAM-dependent methyltransferase n=1 Tax=Lysinibacillus cavernae TaxID=2666135 RepID=UPI0012D9AA9A|nr:class I SAM-dependent methyltransferase [Lysinibacillus cavernae]